MGIPEVYKKKKRKNKGTGQQVPGHKGIGLIE